MPLEVYQVESILDYRYRKGVLEYKVKWKGYEVSESTWQPEDNLNDCAETIREFKREVGLPEEEEAKKEKEEEIVVPSRSRSRKRKDVDFQDLHQSEDIALQVTPGPAPRRKTHAMKTSYHQPPMQKRRNMIRRSISPLQTLAFQESMESDDNNGLDFEPQTNSSQPDKRQTLQSSKETGAIIVTSMLSDSDNNIFFQVKRDSQTETVTRQEMVNKHMKPLLEFYEKKIHFKMALA